MSTTQSLAPEFVEAEEPHWITRAAFPIITILLILAQTAMGVSLYHRWYWAAIPLILVISHLMHGHLIGFHEASHGLLRKNRRLNEFDGVLIGVFSFTSFTLFRTAHQTHHVHLGTLRDEELWPFVLPTMPRWARILAAFLELSAGLFYTPFIFLRTFLRPSSPIRSKKVRRRIWAEFALSAVIWSILLGCVAWWHVWNYFLWMFFIPAYLAANLQSWRKYIEHVGLTGRTVNGLTRSIIPDGWLGHLFAFTLLHEPYHGVHHQCAGLTHAELPLHRSQLQPKGPDEPRPFPSYRKALLHLLRCLSNPRFGAQWLSRV